MPRVYLSIKIVSRFLDEDELKEFLDQYEEHKMSRGGRSYGFKPSEEELKLFRQNKLTFEEWKKRWNLKGRTAVLSRLGSLHLNSKSLK